MTGWRCILRSPVSFGYADGGATSNSIATTELTAAALRAIMALEIHLREQEASHE